MRSIASSALKLEFVVRKLGVGVEDILSGSCVILLNVCFISSLVCSHTIGREFQSSNCVCICMKSPFVIRMKAFLANVQWPRERKFSWSQESKKCIQPILVTSEQCPQFCSFLLRKKISHSFSLMTHTLLYCKRATCNFYTNNWNTFRIFFF